MPENKIGIEIDVKATGSQGLRQQIEHLKEINQVSSQFEALRRDAGEKFPQELDKQNKYIKEQLRLLKQIETAGSRERLAQYQDDKRQDWSTKEKATAEARILSERREHVLAGAGFTEADIQRQLWAEKMGLGVQAGGGGFGDDLTDVMMAGRGGVGAMGALAGGKAFGKARAMLGGMSGGAKLAAGTGIGIAALLGYGAYKVFKGGMDTYADIAPDITRLMTLTNDIPTGRTGQENFELGIAKSSVAIAESLSNTIQLETEWMKLSGIVKTAGDVFEKSIITGKAFGLTPDQTLGYLTGVARAGYLPVEPTEKDMRNIIQAANRAGMPGARIPEFIQTFSAIMPTILGTAVTADPTKVLELVSQFAGLGLPFQGERGANVMQGLHQGIAGGQGFAFEAARRIMVERGEKPTPWGIQRQMEKGLNEENLRGIWEVAMEASGGDIERAAFLSARAYNQPMALWYNPDKDRNSIAEMIMETGTPISRGGDVGFGERIKAMLETYGFGKQQYDIAKEAGAMLIASRTFGGAAEKFHDAVTLFIEKGILIDVNVEQNTNVYKASALRSSPAEAHYANIVTAGANK